MKLAHLGREFPFLRVFVYDLGVISVFGERVDGPLAYFFNFLEENAIGSLDLCILLFLDEVFLLLVESDFAIVVMLPK